MNIYMFGSLFPAHAARIRVNVVVGMICYHLGCNVIIWAYVIIWDEMLSSGANVIIWDEMLSSGMKCYHLGLNVIIWGAML